MNDVDGPELRGFENYPIAATRARVLYRSRISNLQWLKHIQGITQASHRSPRTGASFNMLSAVPYTTHIINTVDHDGQVSERAPSHSVDREANGSMFDGLWMDDEERRNAELESLKNGEHRAHVQRDGDGDIGSRIEVTDGRETD